MEEADCLEVSSNRSDVDVFESETPGLLDRSSCEECADSATATVRIYDNRRELRRLSLDEESAQPKDLIRVRYNPEAMELWVPEVGIELDSRIWRTDRWVFVDIAMAFYKTAPKLTTSIKIPGVIFANRC